MKTSRLFITTAVIEAATGLALLIVPAVVIGLLIGASVEAPGGIVIARVTGLAMLSIAIACWTARGGQGVASRGLVLALLFYNSTVALVLIHAAVGSHLSAIGLWPTVALHTALAAWCAFALRAPAAAQP
jgi:hypothetical protein